MANDTDIFGASTGRAVKDADIFGDMTPRGEAPAPAAAPETPVGKRRVRWGDSGAQLSAADAMGAFNQFLENQAYKAGGAVTDFAAKFLPPEGAAGLGFGANVGLQAIPTFLGGSGAAKVAAPVLRSAAEGVMQSALKPSATSLVKGYGGAPSKADRAVGTMLDEGINVSESGVAKLHTKIAEGKSAINEAIAGSNATIDKQAVANRLQDTTKRFEKQPLPDADLQTIENAYTKFMRGPLPNQIPVAQAQAVKEGGGTLLKKKYGQLGAADVEAEKGLVRGFKEEIEKVVPGVNKLNAHESDLINALLLADRRSGMAGNKDLAGISLIANDPRAAAALMLDRSSVFKSVVARLINANQRTAPILAGSAGGAAYGAGVLGEPSPPRGVLMEQQ